MIDFLPLLSCQMFMCLKAIASAVALLSIAPASAGGMLDSRPREQIRLVDAGEPLIALQAQRPARGPSRADVLYVHGSSFGANLSIYFAFDDHSWADELERSGFTVWGFDFVGYGDSDRHLPATGRSPGDIHDALHDLRRVVHAIRGRNGNQPIVLVAHSRGGVVAARYAAEHPAEVAALVLFAPVVRRSQSGMPARPSTEGPSHYPLSAWAQYRRFVEDVPVGEEQVLSEAHMQVWSDAWLASDPSSTTRMPPSVMIPSGPRKDAQLLWSGHDLYDPTKITAPTLLVRGAWDSVCNDADAKSLMARLTGAGVKHDLKIPRATHLMHLEQQRTELYAAVNRFLLHVLR